VGTPSEPTVEVYEDSAGEWRWRPVAENGNITADGGEGDAAKRGAKRGVESVRRVAPETVVHEVEDWPVRTPRRTRAPAPAPARRPGPAR